MHNAIKAWARAVLPIKLKRGLKAVYGRSLYSGSSYTCPLCASNLRTFLPFGLNHPILTEKNVVGGGYRENALCPVCGSTDRERLVYLYLLQKTAIFSTPCHLLHVAPESVLSRVLQRQPSIDYLTADLYPANVMVKMDITDIQFPDHSFDVIICNHVLEHIIDDHQAMSELYRVLKPGGWAILQVPFSGVSSQTYEDFSIVTPADREQAFGQSDHVRIYAKEDYQCRLKRTGFSVNIFNWFDETEHFGGSTNRFGLNPQECTFVASKN